MTSGQTWFPAVTPSSLYLLIIDDVSYDMVVIVILDVVVVDSQEVVILELRSFEVGSDQFQEDLDDDAAR